MENLTMLENITTHGRHVRVNGGFGFTKDNAGNWRSLGLDKYDEAEAKMWAVNTLNKGFVNATENSRFLFEEEKQYLRAFKNGGMDKVIDRKIETNKAYLNLPRERTTAIDALEQTYTQQGKALPDLDKLFEESGKSTMQDHVLRK